jgi:hypothetical protein
MERRPFINGLKKLNNESKETQRLGEWKTQSCQVTGARGGHGLYLNSLVTAHQ